MTVWNEKRLGDVIEIHDNRRVPLSSTEREKRKGKFRYYGAQGVIDYIDDYIFDGEYILVAEDGENLNSRKLPLASLVDGKFWVNNHAHIIREKEGISRNRFLLYVINNLNISAYVTGAAQPKLNQENLKRIEIRIPELSYQDEIIDALSPYDNLIENNQRRIKILEEMAQSLYREWFVHFRFPNHENTPMVQSPLGPIPQGWEVRNLGEAVRFVKKTVRPENLEQHRKYLPIDCLPRECLSVSEYRPIEEAQSSLVLFDKKDILFGSMRPYFHKVVIAPFDGVTRATCFVFRPLKPAYWAWSTMQLFQKETVDFANAHSKGATIPYASWEDGMAQMKVVFPPEHIVEDFEKGVAKNLEWILNAHHVQERLKNMRDTLLPKLISGEIDLSAATANLQEAA